MSTARRRAAGTFEALLAHNTLANHAASTTPATTLAMVDTVAKYTVKLSPRPPPGDSSRVTAAVVDEARSARITLTNRDSGEEELAIDAAHARGFAVNAAEMNPTHVLFGAHCVQF